MLIDQKIVFDGSIINTFERRGFYYLIVSWKRKTNTAISCPLVMSGILLVLFGRPYSG